MTEDRSLKETVFTTFLTHPELGPKEMAEYLKVNYNSVKAIYAKLCDDGLLLRASRGEYTTNIPGILISMLTRIDALERKLGY